MSLRVLVLEAGTPTANNLIRSLQAGKRPPTVVGCSDNRFFLKKSPAKRNCLLPLSSRHYAATLRRIIREERIDLVIPSSDPGVREIAGMRRNLGCRTFLPSAALIERCQDKYALTLFLRRIGLPAPLTCLVENARQAARVFKRFGRRRKLWCRVRRGGGSYAALPVETPEQLAGWMRYWEEMRAVPPRSFTLSEYLPGRDFCVQCLWDRGTLVLAKMAERLVYLDSGSPSGVSSMPALARTVYEPAVIQVCEQAVRAIDPRASGVLFVDLKESERGEPCITEINAGRFATMTNIHDLVGRHNMTSLYVRLAMGERVRVEGASDFADGYYLVRSLDTEPMIVAEDALFRGIVDRHAQAIF